MPQDSMGPHLGPCWRVSKRVLRARTNARYLSVELVKARSSRIVQRWSGRFGLPPTLRNGASV